MIYKNFKNLLLPSLGVGTMRLPTLPDGTVDEEACREMFSYAMEHGVNYFDTAYGYHNGRGMRKATQRLSERKLLSHNEVSRIRSLEHEQGRRDIRRAAQKMPHGLF